jgi:hypothetical protein
MEEDIIIETVNPRKSPAELLADRKTALLRQGEFYRVGVAHAQAHVKDGMRPEAIFHRAIDHATWAVRSRVDRLLKPGGGSATALLPYAVSLLGFLSRRKLMRPALGVAAVVALGSWAYQRRLRRLQAGTSG